jgi:hypothetical protein
MVYYKMQSKSIISKATVTFCLGDNTGMPLWPGRSGRLAAPGWTCKPSELARPTRRDSVADGVILVANADLLCHISINDDFGVLPVCYLTLQSPTFKRWL